MRDAVPLGVRTREREKPERRHHEIQKHLEAPAALLVDRQKPEQAVLNGDDDGVGRERDEQDDGESELLNFHRAATMPNAEHVRHYLAGNVGRAKLG